MELIPGRWTTEDIDSFIRAAARTADPGERIGFLSEKFIGTPYQEHTLKGGPQTPEVPVINLAGLDCFTFLDYIEALRRSGSFTEFTEILLKVRYRDGVVSYATRNHFFTDWILSQGGYIADVTAEVGGQSAGSAAKNLNMREGGGVLLPGVEQRKRVVTYIPASHMGREILGNLQTGDYAGMYSPAEGLDVSHVGIVIRKGEAVFFRHASSLPAQRAVVDEDLQKYLTGQAGLVVLRPITTLK